MEKTSFKRHYRAVGSSGLDPFAHADWGKSETRRSTTGMMAGYNKGTIFWKTNLRTCLFKAGC